MKPSLWIEAEHVEEPIDDFCNVIVEVPDGERYALNIWTFDFFAVAREHGEPLASEALSDRYMRPPDLFVVELTRPTLEAVIGDLHAKGLLPDHCRIEASSADSKTGQHI